MKRDGSGGTGHGTSRYMPVPLRTVLLRDRYQAYMKRKARHARGVERAEHAKKGGTKAGAHTDLAGFWQVALKRQFGAPLGQKGDAARERAARMSGPKKPGLLRRVASAFGLA
jgi:hypothetical protein